MLGIHKQDERRVVHTTGTAQLPGHRKAQFIPKSSKLQ